jgi:hypothetical protein
MAVAQSVRAALGKSVTLHPAVLTPEQRVVLKASAEVAQKWQAYLAGGVGLALQLGHRLS